MILVLSLLVACGEDPTTEGLVGMWDNDDDAVSRQLLFEDSAYEIVVDEALVQSGTYEVADDTLVTVDGEERTMDDVLVWTVGFDASGTPAGTSYGDPIYRFTGKEMDLRSASAESGRRTWIKRTE